MATKTTAPVTNENDYWEELVEFKPPYDRLHRDDVFLCVNGDSIVVSPKLVHESGKPVMVKRKFVRAYELAEAQQLAADEYSEAHEDR